MQIRRRINAGIWTPSVPWLFSLHSFYKKAELCQLVARVWLHTEIQLLRHKIVCVSEAHKTTTDILSSALPRRTFHSLRIWLCPIDPLIKSLRLLITMLPAPCFCFVFVLSVHLEICWHMSDDNHVIFTDKVSEVPTKLNVKMRKLSKLAHSYYRFSQV